MHLTRKQIACNIMLILAAAIWGSNFIFQKLATATVEPLTFMAGRYTLGALTLGLLTWYMEHQRRNALKESGLPQIKYGKPYFQKLIRTSALCVIANVAGVVMVQYGLAFTTASKAGFLNSIYIIFVPFMGLLFYKKKTRWNVYVGLVLAVIGLYHLCLTEELTLAKGDLIILSSTIFFALHIQFVDKYVHELVGMHFSFVEFIFASIYCWIGALLFEHPTLEMLQGGGLYICYAGILGIGICYALQVTAQKHTDPTVAALLMSMESVFAALCGILFLHESFTQKEFIGILFIVVSIIVAQLPKHIVDRFSKGQEEQAS